MPSDPFYKSEQWQHLRKQILRRDNYMDRLMAREGKIRDADTVHHIFPLNRYPEYALKPWNLISVTRDTHELLHNRVTGGLSDLGQKLLEETARTNGIPISRLILVIGLPGSGKTTYVKHHLNGGLVYDLDYIAGAFRLATPKSETHWGARRLANSMVKAFAQNARRQVGTVYIIRTGPDLDEVIDIDPNEIVVCDRPGQLELPDRRAKIEEIRAWAEANGIPVEGYPPHPDF